VVSFDEKHPNQVSAYGTKSWAIFSRPSGTKSQTVTVADERTGNYSDLLGELDVAGVLSVFAAELLSAPPLSEGAEPPSEPLFPSCDLLEAAGLEA
jgi:hypothetical protein